MSAANHTAELNRRWFLAFAMTCSCAPIELREDGHLEWAHCGKPVVRREGKSA